MKQAILTVKNLTNEVNGYGMPIVDVLSSENIKVINRGYNEFEAVNDIDESDLLRLRTMFSTFSNDVLMLRIHTPERVTNCWYKLAPVYFGNNASCIMW